MNNLESAKEKARQKHIQKNCMIDACPIEADNWIDMRDITNRVETFYLCEEHTIKLINESGEYIHLNVDTGEIITKEIAAYSCSPTCSTCNP